ncbi:MAG TPA: hypothetical protein VHS31_16145, partial [Tepidisphaeraceae bacterium]|nr:hypothetical protein [Tepidisphaeraceae bacterium]
HNTVTPGDAIQSHNIVSPIIQYAAASNRAFAITDLTPAYPNDATSLHRGIALLDRARVLVQDEYQPTKTNEPLHWVMITPTKIELSNDGHSAILTSNGKTLRADLLEPTTAKFHIASTRPPTPAESQNDGTEMLAIDLIPNTDGSSTRLAVLLTPVGKNWPKLNPPALIPLNEWK